MSEETKALAATDNWRSRALIIGGVLGALVGVAAAYLYIQRAQEEEKLEISAGEGVKIGVLVLGLLRSIATL